MFSMLRIIVFMPPALFLGSLTFFLLMAAMGIEGVIKLLDKLREDYEDHKEKS